MKWKGLMDGMMVRAVWKELVLPCTHVRGCSEQVERANDDEHLQTLSEVPRFH